MISLLGMTVIPWRNFKEWLQLYVNFVCVCGGGEGGGGKVSVKRVNKRPGMGVGVGLLPYMGYMGMCHCEGYGFQAVYCESLGLD